MNTVQKIALQLCSPFARMANKINWRFGRRYQCSYQSINNPFYELSPGTIVLTHKKFELTNIFIGGYWTHAALVSSNGTVIEAIYKGVVENDIKQFFNTVDDYILLKPALRNKLTGVQVVDNAKKYLGMPYNFSFIPNDKEITCVELITRSLEIPLTHLQETEGSGFIHYFSKAVAKPEALMGLQNCTYITRQAALAK